MATTPLTLCSQAKAYLDSLPKRPMWERDVAELRREMQVECLAYGGQPQPVAFAEDIDAGGVPARLYLPVGDETSVLVWLHGGAWMLGDPDCHDVLARAIGRRAGCGVLSVNYRRAPEHRYPAATDDAWLATTWARERFDNLAIGGDSAGGNLAAAAALRAREHRLPLAMQLLIYPALDSDSGASYRSEFMERYRVFNGHEGFAEHSRRSLRHFWDVYVPDATMQALPDASPMRAKSLADVAPVCIITAEHDFLRPESEMYARRLRAERIAVELHNYAGQVHGFFHLLGLMDDAHDAVAKAADALRRAFS